MDKTKFLFLLFVFLLFYHQSYSQVSIVQKTDSSGYYNLSDIVITATRTNTSTLELANSITTIDSAEIDASGKFNVFDLLKSEAGISYTTQGPAGSLANINIRGGDNGNTLVIVDGIKMNMLSDPANVYDFANLPVEEIERIEILRGPQSTLYGSDALSGVINIITKKGNGKPLINFLAEGGSYNTFKSSLGVSGSNNKLHYNLSLSRTQSDGFSSASEKYGNTERDGYKGNNFISRFGYELSESAYLDLSVRFTKSDADYDQQGGEFGDDPTYKYKQEEFATRTEGGFHLLDGSWNQKIGFSFYKNLRKYNYQATTNNPVSSRSHYDGKRFEFDWFNNFNLAANHNIIFGVNAEIDQSESEFYSLSEFGEYESAIPERDVSTFSSYLQDQLEFGKSFFATLGIRYDNHGKFGSAYTYRIAPAYILWKTGTKIKATLGTGFKAPSIFYLYDPLFGNEKLNPEKSLGWDAGIEQYFWNQGFSIGVTYFRNNFKDLFGFDENYRTININEAITYGGEVFLNVKIENFTLKLNYTYMQTKDNSKNSPDYNKPLLRRPVHKIGLFSSYRFINKGLISAEIIYVGDREDKMFLPDFTSQMTTLNSYTIVNVAVQFDIFSFLKVNARVDNLFDKSYEEVYGYATSKRSFYGGMGLNF